MGSVTIDRYIHLIPAMRHSPKQYLWPSYDAEADVLYVNFNKRVPRSEDPDVSGHVDNSSLTDDEVIGLTILNASQRFPES